MTVNTFTILQKISVSNKYCSVLLSIHQRILKKIGSAKTLTVFNCNKFLEPLKILISHSNNQLHFQYIKWKHWYIFLIYYSDNISQYCCFFLFWSNKLGECETLKNIKNLINPTLLNCSVLLHTKIQDVLLIKTCWP